jgi:hypothetical protein
VIFDGVLDWILDLLTTLPHGSHKSNYSAIANLHNLQIITGPTKPFPACCVFTSHSLVMVSNSGDSSASALKFPLNGDSQLPLFFKDSPTELTRFRVTLRLAVYRQSVRLGDKFLETHEQNFIFQLNTCGYSSYVTFSLTRGLICRL